MGRITELHSLYLVSTWPRNFAVSLGVEALIAQSIARAVMNRWHLFLDARPVTAAAAEDC